MWQLRPPLANCRGPPRSSWSDLHRKSPRPCLAWAWQPRIVFPASKRGKCGHGFGVPQRRDLMV